MPRYSDSQMSNNISTSAIQQQQQQTSHIISSSSSSALTNSYGSPSSSSLTSIATNSPTSMNFTSISSASSSLNPATDQINININNSVRCHSNSTNISNSMPVVVTSVDAANLTNDDENSDENEGENNKKENEKEDDNTINYIVDADECEQEQLLLEASLMECSRLGTTDDGSCSIEHLAPPPTTTTTTTDSFFQDSSACESILHYSTTEDGGLVAVDELETRTGTETIAANNDSEQPQQQHLEMILRDDGKVVVELEANRMVADVCCLQTLEHHSTVCSSMVEAIPSSCDYETDTDIYISRFDEQHQPPAPSSPFSRLQESNGDPIGTSNRIERSNSCSQADTIHSIEQQQHQQLCGAEGEESLGAAAAEASAVPKCSLGPTSISHENLSTRSENNKETTIVYGDIDIDNDKASSSLSLSSIPPVPPIIDCKYTQEQGTDIDKSASSTEAKYQQDSPETPTKNEAVNLTLIAAQQKLLSSSSSTNQSNFNTGTSRFFSSKLNTGSLWSLLSVGSNHSTNSTVTNANEHTMASTAIDNNTSDPVNYQKSSSSSLTLNNEAQHKQKSIVQQQQQQQQQQQDRQQSQSKSSLGAGFFNRVQQFKRQHSNQEQATTTTTTGNPNQRPPTTTSSSNSSIDDSFSSIRKGEVDLIRSQNHHDHHHHYRKGFRFQLKYIGSAMLHKNFTLPMLEWIARDIKRQTIKGAQSTSQRQFTIPARDIILEIQSYQLMGTSCKDGHCIFVHPMHCVSKYAQLQHDPNGFSYLIRDTKESPYFCHVFQAKNIHKVHEIFSAIREATTSNQSQLITATKPMKLIQQQSVDRPGTGLATSLPLPIPLPLPLPTTGNGQQSQLRVQKSASTDGQTRNVLGNSSPPTTTPMPPSNKPVFYSSLPISSTSSSSSSAAVVSTTGARTRLAENVPQPENAQFENSYQFEVMFVKKVKLQCRRVPASFVDDALETLKSFDVLKGTDSKAQIKGIGKRIISASVDERQEYDEVCQSPTPQVPAANQFQDDKSNLSIANTSISGPTTNIPILDEQQRRGSSASLRRANQSSSPIKEERESRSCQQSPAKTSSGCSNENSSNATNSDEIPATQSTIKKHHQSMSCLDIIDSTIRSAKLSETPHYFNDFSPYNTITSNDLNERIAAIPVVSSSSVSLDHETRQKLARQVRETIMATAANIKKDVYASGDKLDTSSSFKVLDSLSCTAVSSVPSIDDNELENDYNNSSSTEQKMSANNESSSSNVKRPDTTTSVPSSSSSAAAAAAGVVPDHRRSSAAGQFFQSTVNNSQTTNNFDLFRRASARQVVKNRTMLLLIGKDELCTISIDKHQVLFSKSFSSIVHCLQGNNNRDHFGLICRDSGKINPNTESYAGLIFKCQSDKVVREIMGALKQVIYNSQHNYHGYNSIYNPLNATAKQQLTTTTKSQNLSKLERAHTLTTTTTSSSTQTTDVTSMNKDPTNSMEGSPKSLAAKRGFSNHLELDNSSQSNGNQPSGDDYHRQHHPMINTAPLASSSTSTSSVLSSKSFSANSSMGSTGAVVKAPKNLIKSMFCDNCPLYWYHRLCCDIESLPAEASKAIILRRIDSSLAEREQDELYSKFSDFNIETIDEHNEIFMSLLRHICERNQHKHNQTQSHQAAIAKNNPTKQQSTLPSLVSRQSSLQTPTSAGLSMSSALISNSTSFANALSRVSTSTSTCAANTATVAHSGAGGAGHHRSGSSGGSLGFVLGQSSNQTISDAGTMAMDNLKRAKNNLSVSIENMLKRRSSIKDDMDDYQHQHQSAGTTETRAYLPTRSGSFRSATRESRAAAAAAATGCSNSTDYQQQFDDTGSGLKRSSSTSDYSSARQLNQSTVASWKDSFSRTINDDLTNPIIGLFRRRSSTFGQLVKDNDDDNNQANSKQQKSSLVGNSTDALNRIETKHFVTPQHQPVSPSSSFESRFNGHNPMQTNGGSSPSSMLSSAFWKKSIFDKIRQPQTDESPIGGEAAACKESEVMKSAPRDLIESNQSVEQKKQASEQVNHRTKRTREELRLLWKKAIIEQITLIKMDKQNQRIQQAAAAVVSSNVEHYNIQGIKLNYKDVPFKRDSYSTWDKLLKQDPTKKVEFVEVARLVRFGVPKQCRGEIWMFLMNQYQLRHGTSFQPIDSDYHGDANQTYRSLLSQLSTQQHEIFVDIGRTFPTHPYYSQYLSIGQLSLFNLLKAYSLLDQEVGYCQGLSFVAGILLLHVDSEDEAFELMRHLLFNFGLRKQYLPSMNALHLQLYQITRLLRDYEYEMFHHFDRYDISPSLYAAPWFLTLFASQFPLGFVARLLDLIYLMGIEAIFRVSLNLLAYHRAAILDRKSLESTMDFIRSDLVKIDDKNLALIFDKSMSIDLRNKLIEYEIEYTFYCAEDKTRSASSLKPYQLANTQNALSSSSSSLLATDKDNAIQRLNSDDKPENEQTSSKDSVSNLTQLESTSIVADATATVIIQHLLANNHLKSLQSNYSY